MKLLSHVVMKGQLASELVNQSVSQSISQSDKQNTKLHVSYSRTPENVNSIQVIQKYKFLIKSLSSFTCHNKCYI